MFDFGHVISDKEARGKLLALVKSTDPENLRLALKIIRAVSR
jgi:hypothetical protein